MTYFAGTVDLSSGKNTSFQGVQSGLLGYIIGNESGYTVVVEMQGTGQSKTLYPGTVDIFEAGESFSGTIKFTLTSKLSNVSSWPSTFLQLDAVGIRDTINENSYPIPLPRLVNIGGSVNFVTGIATAIQNDGNVAGTQIIESTVSGDVGSCVTLTNDGNLVIGDAAHHGSVKFDNNTISSNGSGTLSVANLVDNGTLIIIGASSLDNGGITTDGAGNVSKVGNITSASGTVKANSIDTNLTGSANYKVSGQSVLSTDGANKQVFLNSPNVGGGGAVDFQIGGVGEFEISTGAISQLVSGNGFEWFNNNFLPEISFFTGNGSGTYNHGFNGAGESISPFHVIPIVNQVGSATQGYDSITTTQVHITLGAALNFKAFCV